MTAHCFWRSPARRKLSFFIKNLDHRNSNLFINNANRDATTSEFYLRRIDEAEAADGQHSFLPGLASSNNIGPNTDWAVLEDDYIAITPMQLDQTDYESLKKMADWFPLP